MMQDRGVLDWIIFLAYTLFFGMYVFRTAGAILGYIYLKKGVADIGRNRD